MSDKEVIHRWLTQAELEKMIEAARLSAATRAISAARKVAWEHGQNQVLDIALSAISIEDVK
jgi:hypothetical protein